MGKQPEFSWQFSRAVTPTVAVQMLRELWSSDEMQFRQMNLTDYFETHHFKEIRDFDTYIERENWHAECEMMELVVELLGSQARLRLDFARGVATVRAGNRESFIRFLERSKALAPSLDSVPLSDVRQRELDRVVARLLNVAKEYETSLALAHKMTIETFGDGKDIAGTAWEAMGVLERTYDEKLALEAPAKYWNDAAKKHGKRAKSLFWSMIGFSALLALAVGGAIGWVRHEWITSTPPAWVFVACGLGFGVLAYGIRLITRGWLSARHLQVDASQRELVVMTYLALLRTEDVTPEDRQIALAAVFRPAQIGLIGEEAPPSSIVDLLKGMVGKPQ